MRKLNENNDDKDIWQRSHPGNGFDIRCRVAISHYPLTLLHTIQRPPIHAPTLGHSSNIRSTLNCVLICFIVWAKRLNDINTLSLTLHCAKLQMLFSGRDATDATDAPCNMNPPTFQWICRALSQHHNWMGTRCGVTWTRVNSFQWKLLLFSPFVLLCRSRYFESRVKYEILPGTWMPLLVCLKSTLSWFTWQAATEYFNGNIILEIWMKCSSWCYSIHPSRPQAKRNEPPAPQSSWKP